MVEDVGTVEEINAGAARPARLEEWRRGMAKKSFWQRGEDYAEKVSEELIEQIKAGVAPWQKPWKPGEQISPENLSTGKTLQRRQQPLPDEQGYPSMATGR